MSSDIQARMHYAGGQLTLEVGEHAVTLPAPDDVVIDVVVWDAVAKLRDKLNENDIEQLARLLVGGGFVAHTD